LEYEGNNRPLLQAPGQTPALSAFVPSLDLQFEALVGIIERIPLVVGNPMLRLLADRADTHTPFSSNNKMPSQAITVAIQN
jgi:hypothetical protein